MCRLVKLRHYRKEVARLEPRGITAFSIPALLTPKSSENLFQPRRISQPARPNLEDHTTIEDHHSLSYEQNHHHKPHIHNMPLTSLPLEMILSFCTFLPEADSESLRNTCRGLRSALPPTPILNAPSNPPKHTNPHRRQWASPLQQPIFLLRLLRDMPSDTKRDLIVCRICISIRKRWIRSGDIQHPTKEEEEREGKEQDMTVYNNVDSVCEGCMRWAGRGYDEPETNPLQQSHTLHRLFNLLPPHERSHYIFCRRCVSISPISPLTTNSSTTNDAPGEAPSPPSLHSYTASNSLCNNCTQEYKRLCMTTPREGHPTPAAISRKYHRGGRSIWHGNRKRMSTFCFCTWESYRQASYDGGCVKCRSTPY